MAQTAEGCGREVRGQRADPDGAEECDCAEALFGHHHGHRDEGLLLVGNVEMDKELTSSGVKHTVRNL